MVAYGRRVARQCRREVCNDTAADETAGHVEKNGFLPPSSNDIALAESRAWKLVSSCAALVAALPVLLGRQLPYAKLHRQRARRRQVAKARRRRGRNVIATNSPIEWLGKPLPPWGQPCPITVQVGRKLGAGGATSFVFDRGEVFGWQMTIQGSLERILDSVLPHEVTHTIFASHFRQPLPRWADEGACTTVEHVSERTKQQQMLIQFLQDGPRHSVQLDVRHEGVSGRRPAALRARPLAGDATSSAKGARQKFCNSSPTACKTKIGPPPCTSTTAMQRLGAVAKHVARLGSHRQPTAATRTGRRATDSANLDHHRRFRAVSGFGSLGRAKLADAAAECHGEQHGRPQRRGIASPALSMDQRGRGT